MTSCSTLSGQEVGKIEAASRIFGEYEDFIRETIKRRSPMDAEDLFQDFFVFLASKPVPDYVQNVKGYLYRALTNDIHDFFRQSTNYKSRLRRYSTLLRYTNIRRTHEQIFSDADVAEHIFQIVNEKLPPYLARTFILHFREQCSIREISAKIGVPPRAVSVYLSKSIKQMRDYVAREEHLLQQRRMCV